MGVVKARCIYCKKKNGDEAKNGTTHLNDHYKCCTKRKLVNIRQKVITPNVMMGGGKRKLEAYTFN